MGLLDVFKKKTCSKKTERPVLLAMPMYNNQQSFSIDGIIQRLKDYWGAEINDYSGDKDFFSISINGSDIIVTNMGFSIPETDWKPLSRYAYNWQNAVEELQHHDNHVIVTDLSGDADTLQRVINFTKVLESIVATSNAIGIYMGSQSLLIPKTQFISMAEQLNQNLLPVNLWVYIGLRSGEKGNSAYTYGLNLFGKNEIEIIDANESLENLFDLLSNIILYILNNDIVFKPGQTLGFTEEQKIKISVSKGVFVEEESFKLKF